MNTSSSFVDRPLVYIAGPYRRPDPVSNTHNAIKEANRLQGASFVTCVVPHITLAWDLMFPHEEDYWLDYDLALLARCDALLRLPGESPGSDNEVRFARERGIPVFFSRESLQSWVDSQ